MQSQASDDERRDSQNDEGFVINQLQIKNHDVAPLIPLSQQRPNDYLPRYITAHHLLREMPEAACSFPHFPHDDQPTVNYTPRRKPKQLVFKPEQQSYNGKNYRLVYQRYAKRVEINDSPTRNDVSLESVVGYSAENYSLAKQWEMPTAVGDDLTFESRFESGNLMVAYRSLVDAHTYKLLMQNDTNSKGYNRWFYFAVGNAKRGISYKLQITNFRKYFEFFRQGLRPTCFSLQQQRETGNGWSKCGRNLQFIKTESSQDYTLSFEVDFDYSDDVCLFSLLPPYSYSKLSNFLLEANQTAQQRPDLKFTLSTVAYSLTNTQVPQITVSGPVPAQKSIIILARQHPGEVWSSFLAEALIRQLMREPSADKDWLLQNYTFHIFPMVNVDGVLQGNFRCDLSGMDMNRCWKTPNKLLHPHLIAIKEEIRRLSVEGVVSTCLDLHSHSKDYNVFAYCCRLDLQGKLLPFLFSRATPIFNFGSCTYGISKYKQSTARAVIHQITRADDVLTIQSSFFASSNPTKVVHPATFLSLANVILLSLKHYYSKTKYMYEIAEDMPKAIAEIAERAKNRKKSINEESGSDSEPECDQIDLSEKIGNILPRCPIVQACFDLKPEQKQTEEGKSKPVKKAKKKKPKKQTKQQPNMEAKLPEKELQTSRVQKPPLISMKNQMNNQFRKTFLEPMFKKRSGYHSRQGKTLQAKPNRSFLNQSLELEFPSSVSKSKPGTEFKSTLREKEQASYEFHYRYEKKKEQEEFPMLCVLSDRRKEAHLERLRRIHPPPSQRERSIPHYQPTLVVNKKLDTMQRLRERQKNSSDLVSSIWRETIGRDGDAMAIRSVFYGGT